MRKAILVALLAFLAVGQHTAQAELPATGQTFCRDAAADIGDCAVSCPGQDGDLQAGCPMEGRFVILPGPNGVVDPAVAPKEDPGDPDVTIPAVDDTVFDRCTGLEWQRSTADTDGDMAFLATDIDLDEVFVPDDGLEWSAALTYCETLDYGGHDDWRLPNIVELHSIVDYGGAGVVNHQTLIDIDDAFIVARYAVNANTDSVHWASTSRPACSTSPVGVRCYAALPVDSLEATGVGFVGPSAGGMGLGDAFDGTVRFVRAVRRGTINAAAGGGAAASEPEGGQGGVTVSGNGDVNGDNGLDLSDAIYLLTHLFQGGPEPLPCPGGGASAGQGGVTVSGNGDVNGDNGLDLSDAIYLLTHLFQGGPAPLACPAATETNCNDNMDNDGDNDTDCDDTDCDADPSCQGIPEICDNATDDDLDGDTDCADADCVLLAGCDIVTDLPATGVTSCYDENGQAIACAGTGQDAEYQAGCRISPRFELDIGPDGLDDRVDSTIIDDTVTDLCTGLEWTRWRQQDSPPGPPGGTWCGWVEYCKVDLNVGGGFAGKTGWRCANVREISTLVQYGLPIPATEVENLIDPVFGKFSRRVSGAAASTLYGEKSFYSARYINGIEGSTAPGDLEASTTVFAVRDAD